MLARTRLAEIGGLHPRRLVRSVRKSLAIPLLFTGVLCAVAPFVYGAVDRTATTSTTVPATVAVPLLTQSTATGSVGHVRVINHSQSAGTVSIVAYDDTGLRHGPVTLAIGAGETVHFNAGDLEEGDTEKGFRSGIGTGTGAWRLELSSTLDIEVLSYAQHARRAGQRDAGCGAARWLGVPGRAVQSREHPRPSESVAPDQLRCGGCGGDHRRER